MNHRTGYPSVSGPVSNGNTDPSSVLDPQPAEGVPKTSGGFGPTEPRLISVKALAQLYDLGKSTVYEHIRSDPSFPVRNVGVRKKFMIDRIEFEKWLIDRTNRERRQTLNIPTANQLLKRFKK